MRGDGWCNGIGSRGALPALAISPRQGTPSCTDRLLYDLLGRTQSRRRCAVRMLCYSKSGHQQLSDVSIHPISDRISQVLLDFRLVSPHGSRTPMPARSDGKPKDLMMHGPASAELDLENDPQTRHKACFVVKGTAPWPILSVNERWCELTGFSRRDTVGNTIHMLQGPATCTKALGALEVALEQQQPLTLRLLNYDASCCPFMNTLQIVPLLKPGVPPMLLGSMLRSELPPDAIRRARGEAITGLAASDASASSAAASPAGEPRIKREQPDAKQTWPPLKRGHASSEGFASSSWAKSLLVGSPPQTLGLGGHDPRSLALRDGAAATGGGDDGVAAVGEDSFLAKLVWVLEAPECRDVVQWVGTGEEQDLRPTFVITDPAQFAQHLLPRCFGHAELATFMRQLGAHGFLRASIPGAPEGSLAFEHQVYVRQQPPPMNGQLGQQCPTDKPTPSLTSKSAATAGGKNASALDGRSAGAGAPPAARGGVTGNGPTARGRGSAYGGGRLAAEYAELCREVALLEASLDNLNRVQTERKYYDSTWLDDMLRMVNSRLQLAAGQSVHEE